MSVFSIISLIDTVFFVVFVLFLRIKIKCPKCSNIQSTLSNKQMGVVMLFGIISFNIYDIIYGRWGLDLSDLIFGTMAIYGLIGKPAYYCRYCFKEMSLKEEHMLNRPFFY